MGSQYFNPSKHSGMPLEDHSNEVCSFLVNQGLSNCGASYP